jgi:hypothetical protein
VRPRLFWETSFNISHFPNCCSFELVIRDGLGSACFLPFFSGLSKEEEEEEEEGSRICSGFGLIGRFFISL